MEIFKREIIVQKTLNLQILKSLTKHLMYFLCGHKSKSVAGVIRKTEIVFKLNLRENVCP